MRENLWLGLFTAVFVGIVAVLAALTRAPVTPPAPEVTCTILDADPEFFAGREVRVRTDGTETSGEDLVYRKRSDQMPVVVLRFRNPLPAKLPPVVTGLCLGRQGSAVLVINCRP